MKVHIAITTHTHVHLHTHTHIHIRTHTHNHTHIYTYTLANTHTHKHTRAKAHTYQKAVGVFHIFFAIDGKTEFIKRNLFKRNHSMCLLYAPKAILVRYHETQESIL